MNPSTALVLHDDHGAALTLRPGPPRRGGEASVYAAEDSAGQLVAVKVAHVPGAPWVAGERALLESLGRDPALCGLVVGVRGGGVWGDRGFLVLEWHPDTLIGWMATGPSPQRRVEMAARLADAVARLHEARSGLVHGDIKPSNVLLDGERLVLADFGGARTPVPGHTVTRRVVHTPGYAPPELCLPGPHASSQGADVYALAATIFQVLVGTAPTAPGRNARCLTADGERLLLGLLTRDDVGWARWLEPSRMVALDDDDQERLALAIGRGAAWRAIASALEPHPERRFTRARALADCLSDTSAVAASRASQPRGWPRPVATGAVATVVVGAVLVAAGLGTVPLTATVAAPAGSPPERFVRFPATTFTDPSTKRRFRIERPYELGVHEVTQATWRAVTGQDPTLNRQTSGARRGDFCREDHRGVNAVGDDLPAVCVSWFDAVAFANRRSAQEGLTSAYRIVFPPGTDPPEVTWLADADGFRLPTIAEWTYAAVGHSGAAGLYAAAGPCLVGNLAGVGRGPAPCDDGFPLLAPVGRFAPTPEGVHDLAGNVAEWLWDPGPDAARQHGGPNFGSAHPGPVEEHVWGASPPGMRTFGIGVRLARNVR